LVPETKVFKPTMLPNPSSLPLKLDPEVGGAEKIMTKSAAEDLEKSKDEANGGGGGRVPPSIFEHGREQSSSFDSSPYIPSSFFDNPFELPQQASTRSSDIPFTNNPPGYTDPPKYSADSAGYLDPPKHSADSPGYYFDVPKCSTDSPGCPDLPHPLSYYYYYIGFPEPLYASSLHPYNDEMHPEKTAEEATSSYTRNSCESSKFYAHGNSYSPCGQSTLFPKEYEDYPQSQFSNSDSTKIDDYFQLFS
jgi:hypothetical protein